MVEDKLQLQRWELKYVITEEVALAVRDFLASYLELDEYGAGRPYFSYPIHNLYLDSDDLRIYWGTINGNKNRYKLRLRFYDDNLNAPIFFEIKRRMNDSIIKQRAGIRRTAVEAVLHGHLPAPNELISGDARQLAAIQRFIQLMVTDHVQPRAHVSYQREAWISRFDNAVRVTLDRKVMISPEFSLRFSSAMDDPTCVFGDWVILELKFTGRFPDWFREMVRIFGLRQGSASKYADGVATKGEFHFFTPGTLPVFTSQPAGIEDRKRERLARLETLLAPAKPIPAG